MQTAHPIRRLIRCLTALALLVGSAYGGAPLPGAHAAQRSPQGDSSARIGDNGIYEFADSAEPGGPAFAWNSIIAAPGAGRLIFGSDDGAVSVNAPFPIRYFGMSASQMRVGNNGAIAFNDTSLSPSYSNLAISAAPDKLIAPFWDDFGTGVSPAGVYTATVGSAPNRQFVVEWHDLPIYGAANSATTASFQVVFSESSSELLFFYNDVDFAAGNGANNGLGATVGIRGLGAAQALQYSYNEAALSSGLAIRFRRLPPRAILAPASQYRQAVAGANAVHPLTLTNAAGAAGVFDLSYAPGAANFPITGPLTATAADLANAAFNATVAVPPGTPAGAEDAATVTATLQGNPAVSATATLRTQAIVSVACQGLPRTVSGSSSAAPSITVPITVAGVTAAGRVTLDTAFAAGATPADLVIDLIDPLGTRVALHNQTANAVSGNYDLSLPVDGPGALADFAGSPGNGVWRLRITRKVGGFSSATLNSCAINLVPAAPGIYLAPASQARLVAPGSTAAYTVTVVNNTDSAQNASLAAASSAGFAIGAPASLSLPPFGRQDVQVTVNTESSAPYLSTDTATISVSAGTFGDSAMLKTTLGATAWERLPDLATQRTSLAAAALGDGTIYAIAGQTGGTAATTSVEVYTPATNSWSAGPALPSGRRDIRAAVLNNKIYIPGGYNGSGSVNTMLVFDGGAWSTAPGTMGTAVNRPVVVSDPQTNRILVFGGQSGFSATNVTQVYTAAGSAWGTLAPLPTALQFAAGARIGRKVYISGGTPGPNTTLYIYDLDANTWATGPALPAPQVEAGGVAIGSRFCLIGGAPNVGSGEIAAVACYDTAAGTWGALPSLTVGRTQAAVVVGANGGVYAIGGNDSATPFDPSCPTIGGSYQHCRTVERYPYTLFAPARFTGSSKTVTPATVSAGGLLTYTLTVSNSGQLAATAFLTDSLSTNVTLETASAGISANGNTLTAAPTVAPNSRATYAVVVRVNAGFSGTLNNSFQLSGDGSLRTFSAPPVSVDLPLTASFGSSAPDTVGQPTTFTALAGGGTAPYSYAWAFGDGSTGSGGPIRGHTYAAAGTYTVTLTVTDGNGANAVATGTVVIAAAPTASLATSGPDTLGQTTMFTATATGSGPLSYAWSFGDGATGSGATASHAYAQAGSYETTLTVTDGNGAQAAATATVTIVGAVSAGWISSAPDTVGQTTTFTATATGSGPLRYAWAFGDGATGAGATASHAYAQPGSYTVTLTVTDGNGANAVATGTVVIAAAPTASLATSGPDTLGQTTMFTATATGSGPLRYAWAFGDGATGAGATASHAYAQPGSYTVTLTVTDSANVSAVASATVAIAAAPSAAIITSGPGMVGETTIFTATASGSAPLSYAWAFGDGATGSGATASHAYAQAGSYDVTLIVTDGNGAQSTASQTIVMVAPTPQRAIYLPFLVR